MDYAILHPTSPLARNAAVLDGLTNERAAYSMLKGLPAGKNVFGGDVYPAPFVDKNLVQRYRDVSTLLLQ